MFLLDRGEGAKNPREKREKEKREAGASKKQACLSAGAAKRVLAFSGITCLSLDAAGSTEEKRRKILTKKGRKKSGKLERQESKHV